jgi:hypothetical protein
MVVVAMLIASTFEVQGGCASFLFEIFLLCVAGGLGAIRDLGDWSGANCCVEFH